MIIAMANIHFNYQQENMLPKLNSPSCPGCCYKISGREVLPEDMTNALETLDKIYKNWSALYL